MLNGSVFLRIAVLLIAAAALTGLVRFYFGHDGGLPEAPLSASAPQPAPEPAPPVERRRAEPAPPPPRDTEPAPTPAPVAPPPDPIATTTPTPPPPPAAEAPVALQPPPEDEPPSPQAAEPANPAGIDPVDLNTASVAQLNGLKGGGAIGRAIVQHRPYTSVDQLLSKRVLSRAIFQRIKTQVTVR